MLLNENDVVKAMRRHLEAEGYIIDKYCRTTEKGIDIVAKHPNRLGRLLIEAKGATSSKQNSARYGQEFGDDQMPEKVGGAVYTALKLSATYGNQGDNIAIAVPDTQKYRSNLQPIREILAGLRITIYLVKDDMSVDIL